MIYLRYSVLNIFLCISIACFLAGGWWLWAAFAFIVFLNTFIDELYGDELGKNHVKWPQLLIAQLYAGLPLLLILSIIFAAYVTPDDRLGFSQFCLNILGIDFAQAKASTNPMQLLGGAVCLGLLYGAAGTNVAHELVHRINIPRDYFVGRCLLGFTFDTSFAIEHVYGHHKHVATLKDPATARRGETVYGFFIRSTIGQFRGAFEIERQRLSRKNLANNLITNRAARGQFLSLMIWFIFFAFGGIYAALIFPLLAIYGKFYLEAVNYIEHFGLVRVPGKRCEARHSWNSHRSVSSAFLYNLPRHSDHHIYERKPFWTLDANEEAPQMPFGYLSMILLALLPFVFLRIMRPRLEHWDTVFATDAERDILKERGELMMAA